jgi:hypothetical protein
MISKDKQYRTRDGLEVRIYATDGSHIWAVHGAICTEDGWWSTCWTKDGKVTYSVFDASSGSDLIEVKPRIKRTYWLNIYKSEPQGTTALWTRKDADSWVPEGRIACVKVEIDCEEGEGL